MGHFIVEIISAKESGSHDKELINNWLAAAAVVVPNRAALL
jgi:hypothetical protein